jgi:PucR C-terminal helix-turn-helix domain/GGDEF-like domain
VTLSASTAAPRDAQSGAPLGDLHARTALVALALVREAPGSGGRGALLRALRDRPGADAAILLADADAETRALAQGAIALCARQPDRASWVVPTIVEQFPASLTLQEDGVAWALLPARRADEAGRATTAAALRVAARLGARTAVGLSPFVTGPERLHDALREADVALALVRAGEASPGDAAAGAWQLLVRLAVADPAALRRLCDTSVGPALAHDAAHGSDLVGTFRTYLAHGANMNAAAAAIPSHRHTVAYRLDRLRELTGLHPGSADDRERLGLGVKARLVLDALTEVR